MNDRLKVAVVQLAAHGRDQFSRTSIELLETLARIAGEGAELIICPEGTIPAYVLGPAPLHENEYRACITAIEELAKASSCHIVCGGPSFTQPGTKPENAALVFGPEGLIAAVGKRFLWHFDRHWYLAGLSLDPIETAIGRLGILICADGRIPTIASSMVDRGAELLVMPTAWVSNAANPANYENIQADLFAPIRAWENGVPLVVANKVGVELQSVLYCGKSQIIAADGTILKQASHNKAEVLHHTIPRGQPAPRRSTHPAIAKPLLPLAGQSLRLALAPVLDEIQYDVARWSDVDLIITQQQPNFYAPARVAQTPPFSNTTILAVNEFQAGSSTQPLGIPIVCTNDRQMADPGFLPPFVLAGYDCCIWQLEHCEDRFLIPLTRTRAIELKIYVIVLARNSHERSFVIDPDGVLIGGTTQEYRLVQWVYDPNRTRATTVAPSTNIHDGLQLSQSLSAS